jgi:hypothetical protein
MSRSNSIELSPLLLRLGRFHDWTKPLWLWLSGLESRLAGEGLLPASVDRPVYICGLARSGTTILLELLSEHPDTSCHRYRDFPFIFTPVIWDWVYQRAGTRKQPASERSHKDGIMVTPESPEAMEEMIWAELLPASHDPSASNVLRAGDQYPVFERQYRDHIRKIISIRGAPRYLSKGNYNLSRMEFLLGLFDGARFVVPVRDPEGHVSSLMKQHRLFTQEAARDGRISEHLRRAGHFEFGPVRLPINFGDKEVTSSIERLWAGGQEVRGWARYWASAYAFVARTLSGNSALSKASVVIDYRSFCQRPYESLALVYNHCGLEASEELLRAQAARISYPEYYTPSFSEEEREIIHEETATANEAITALVDNME